MPDVSAPSLPPDRAVLLLDEAKVIVTGARRQAYGAPEDNFACIAEFWSEYLSRREQVVHDMSANLTRQDVAVMMILMKCARLAESPDHHDSVLDIAGYAACLARCQS